MSYNLLLIYYSEPPLRGEALIYENIIPYIYGFINSEIRQKNNTTIKITTNIMDTSGKVKFLMFILSTHVVSEIRTATTNIYASAERTGAFS